MQQDQDPQEILAKEEMARHEAFVRAGGGHGDGPFEAGLETLCCAGCVVVGDGVGRVEGLVDEGAVDEVFGVVVAGAEEGDLDVEVVGVAGGGRVEVGGEH